MKKKWVFGIAILAFLWLAAGTVDVLRVSSFEKPLFCAPCVTADDGGSGHYRGLGYSFDIEGHFLPEADFPGVTAYSLRILGAEVCSDIRD